jgi:DNA polymerase I/DNA polymerase-2
LKENLLVLDADYTMVENKPVVRLYCKDEKSKTVLVLDNTFKPYFFVMPKEGKLAELKKKIENLETKKLEAKILKVEIVEKNWQGEKTKLIKITIDNPRRILDVRDAVKDWEEVEETYEYAISFYRRYLIDKEIFPTGWIEVEGNEVKSQENYQVNRIINAEYVKAIKLEKEIPIKILAFDTEFVEEDGKQKLIMLSTANNSGLKKVLTTFSWEKAPKYVEFVRDEKELIEKFLKIVREQDPDFICSYNGDGFDFPRLKERAEEFHLKLKLGRDEEAVKVVRRGRISSARTKGRVHIDLFVFIDHILSPSMKSEVLTLDEVAQELLGIGKKEMKYKEMVEIWSKKEQLNRLAEYSMWDSELTLKLAEHILPQIFAISRITGLIPFDACRNTYSQLVEAFLMKRAFADNVLIPNSPKQEELQKRKLAPTYKGAIVIEPKKGIHSDILVFDFRSLYPTVICTHNISPETFNCEHKECKEKNRVPETKWHFCIKKKGFIPKHLEDLIKTRQQIKNKMKKMKEGSEEWRRLDNEQYALKIIANATYGYFGFFGSKWYRRECGAAAAAWGRYYISFVIEEAKKFGLEIIYGDTDSLMVHYPEELSQTKIRQIGEKFEKIINEKLPGIIELEFRDLYEGGVFVARQKGEVGAKKRYALIDYKGNLEVRGFETVRRDWCELSKRMQREVLTIILREKDPTKAIQLVRDTIKKIREGKVTLDELTIFEQITRPLSQYEQIGPHVKAAQKARARGRPVGEGTVIGFVITKGSGSISDRAEPIEDVKPNQYDPNYYVEHQILPASMRVLKALGYTEQEVLSEKMQKKLDGFLKKIQKNSSIKNF